MTWLITLSNVVFFTSETITHKTSCKETIKALFMYIIIHKLDLYINIAFHPNNEDITILIKVKQVFNLMCVCVIKKTGKQ